MDWNIFKAKVSGGGKAAEIAQNLREGIASGELPPGTQMAGATALGRAYGCSGSPVEGARKKLVKEGLLVIRGGHYFVAGESRPLSLDDTTPAPAPIADPLAALDELAKG